MSLNIPMEIPANNPDNNPMNRAQHLILQRTNDIFLPMNTKDKVKEDEEITPFQEDQRTFNRRFNQHFEEMVRGQHPPQQNNQQQNNNQYNNTQYANNTQQKAYASQIIPKSREKDKKNKKGREYTNSLLNILNSLQYRYSKNQTTAFLNINEEDLQNYMKYSWPLLHKSTYTLMEDFISFKQKYGTPIEKNIYGNGSYSVYKFLTRLIKKRAVSFHSRMDQWLLKDGSKGVGKWGLIGSVKESTPLTMKNNLTYDELELSALISLSIYTPFINQGSQKNLSIEDNNHERNGIVICQVGPRLEEMARMEWRYMIIDPSQNRPEYGYGPDRDSGGNIGTGPLNKNNAPQQTRESDEMKEYVRMWEKFYDVDHFPTYEEIQAEEVSNTDIIITNSGMPKKIRYIRLDAFRYTYLDLHIYKKRLRINIEVFFREADMRARTQNKKAYCMITEGVPAQWIVGGLIQYRAMIETYLEVLEEETFNNISNVYFSKFADDFENLPKNIRSIKIDRGPRFPFEIIRDGGDDPYAQSVPKLLVCNCEWNSNSYVGNEYFENDLTNSDAASFSCASYISYFGNPDLNEFKKIYFY